MSYTNPPRMPFELLSSDLSDPAKVVWLAVRASQGANATTWEHYDRYGDRCGKSRDMVKKALAELRKKGWIETVQPAGRGHAPHLRCHIPSMKGGSEIPGNETPSFIKGGNETPSFTTQRGESESTKGGNEIPPPYKEDSEQDSKQSEAKRGEAAGARGAGEAEPESFSHLESVPVPLGPSEQYLDEFIEAAWHGTDDAPGVGRPDLSDEEFARLALRSTFGRPSAERGRRWDPPFTSVALTVRLLSEGWPREWVAAACMVVSDRGAKPHHLRAFLDVWEKNHRASQTPTPKASPIRLDKTDHALPRQPARSHNGKTTASERAGAVSLASEGAKAERIARRRGTTLGIRLPEDDQPEPEHDRSGEVDAQWQRAHAD